jgi:hypothetical protein
MPMLARTSFFEAIQMIFLAGAAPMHFAGVDEALDAALTS